MSFIKASGLGPLTASNTATIVDPATPLNGSATMGPLVSFPSQTTTSGTSKDFIGIPSWVKRITVSFNDISTNGTSAPLIQLGAGSIISSGYTSYSIYTGGANGQSSSTAGFTIASGNSNNLLTGHMIITLLGSNTWISSHIMAISGYGFHGAGTVTLSGTLDRIRFTTVNGTDAFDAGSINLMYE